MSSPPSHRPAVKPAVIVHGGAWAIPDGEWTPHRDGVERATRAAWSVILDRGSALDAVERAIVVLEDDPAFDAGTGSVLCRDGRIEMDAAVMEGEGLGVGAVACVREVRNPIRLARAVLGSEHVLLVGEGAHRFAWERGFEPCDPASLIVERERRRLAEILKTETDPRTRWPFGPPPAGPQGTVGAVAVDSKGRVAVGGSTGGTPGKRPGRIGDTPIPGAGLWADGALGGAASTGWGEGILRTGLARTAVQHLRDATAQDAAWLAIRDLDARVHGRGGVIVLSRDGSIGYAFNTPRMAVAYIDPELAEPFVGGPEPAP